jgi:DNA-binding GntR family transcriptional regulator
VSEGVPEGTNTKQSMANTLAIDEQVYRKLRAAIIDQRLAAGSRLTETAVAELLSTSRRHVDKALWRLSQERLVLLRRNAGAWVAAPSFEEAREIYELRLVVEDAVVRKTCAAWRIESMKQLKANLAAETLARQSNHQRAAVRFSGEFHVLLARASGSDEMERAVELLVARTSLVTQLYANSDAMLCWHDSHNELLQHIEQRQEVKACALMRMHLQELEAAMRVDRRRTRHAELERALSN